MQQYDVAPGFDPSSLASITQAEYIQAIEQLAPLSNIGLVIAQAGTGVAASYVQATNGSPDVANNARFARYIWLNTFSSPPTPYYYKASDTTWRIATIAALTITDAEISAAAAIAITKLAFGTSRYILRTNVAANAVEYVAPANTLNANELAVVKLTANGTDGYLKTVAGQTVWVADATERAAIIASISGLSGSAFADHSIGLVKLAAGGAANGDIIRYNGTDWVKASPGLDIYSGAAINNGVAMTGTLNSAAGSVAHGLGSVPRVWKVVAVCGIVEANYALGDEVDIHNFLNGIPNPSIGVSVDTTTIYYSIRGGAVTAQTVVDKLTGASTAITEASWTLKAYAWK